MYNYNHIGGSLNSLPAMGPVSCCQKGFYFPLHKFGYYVYVLLHIVQAINYEISHKICFPSYPDDSGIVNNLTTKLYTR